MIVITSLLVVLLLLSTAVFVIETGKNVPVAGNGEANAFPSYEQSTKSTLISALANVTGGGNENVLIQDLNQLNSVISSDSYQAQVNMNYTLLNSNTYQNGFWISWGTEGYGVSSDSVSFAFYSLSPSTTSNAQFNENITSEAYLSGTYLQLSDTTRLAQLSINLLNEGVPALAQNFTFYFQNQTNWTKADMPTITDFGNGTYTASFIAEQAQTSNPLVVSLLCQDQRGVLVGANATCSSTG